MGRWLADQGLAPDHVISSPATRAGKTAREICSACDFDLDAVHWDERMYLSSVATMIEVLGECPDSACRVFLIGHNPGMEGLLEYLTGYQVQPYDDGKLMPTAAIAQLQLSTDWCSLDSGTATLKQKLRPSMLAESAKF